jgi:hypothetical protein
MLPLPGGKRIGEPLSDGEFLDWIRGVFLALFDAKPEDDAAQSDEPESASKG